MENIKPDIINLLEQNPKSKLSKVFKDIESEEKTLYLYDSSALNNKSFASRKFTYSEDKKADLNYSFRDESIILKYNDIKHEMLIPTKFKYIKKYIPPAVSIALSQDISIENIKNSIISFELHPNQMLKGIKI